MAVPGSWHSCPFFPGHQYLLVCSHRSLENTQEAGLNVIRLQLCYLQALASAGTMNPPCFSVSFPKALQEYHSSQGCTELLVILITSVLIKQSGILH